METKNLVQTTANVIRVTNLKVGDIYKRYDDSSYSKKTYYGIVRTINNNGEKTYIEAVEYEYSYSSLSANFSVFGGDEDINIFPATIEEIKNEFGGAVTKLYKEIESKEDEIKDKRKCVAETELLLSGELQKTLQTAEFKEMTQGEYNTIKENKAQLLAQLND